MRFSIATLALPVLASVVLALPQPTEEHSVERRQPADLEVRNELTNLKERSDVASRVTARTLVARGALGSGAIVDGSNANTVRALQWLLTARGHATAVDGAIGPNTRAAVTAFQRAAGLTADGIAGPATLGALVDTVRSGSSGNIVRAAQAALNGNGASLTVDGQFGSGTHAAAVAFQARKGLQQDGIIGPNTWTALFSGGGGAPSGGGDCSAVKSGVTIDQTAIAANNIRVNKCLAGNVAALVAAAARDGVTLTAESSWRDPQEQIRLRIQNCGGNTHYNIYEKPPGQCSPRTAIPGTSRHERGLAIDFKNCGWGSTNFNWLKAHASAYHLYLLGTNDEPWHWSWDGN